MLDEHDEWMPRERGLVLGETWAEFCREEGIVGLDDDGQPVDLLALAAEEVPRIAKEAEHMIMTGSGMRERLDASDDPDAESAFWGGFRDGVRAYLVRDRIGASSN